MYFEYDAEQDADKSHPEDTEDNIRIICDGLDDLPVTNTELEVLETYASDLIRAFVAAHLSDNKDD